MDKWDKAAERSRQKRAQARWDTDRRVAQRQLGNAPKSPPVVSSSSNSAPSAKPPSTRVEKFMGTAQRVGSKGGAKALAGAASKIPGVGTIIGAGLAVGTAIGAMKASSDTAKAKRSKLVEARNMATESFNENKAARKAAPAASSVPAPKPNKPVNAAPRKAAAKPASPKTASATPPPSPKPSPAPVQEGPTKAPIIPKQKSYLKKAFSQGATANYSNYEKIMDYKDGGVVKAKAGEAWEASKLANGGVVRKTGVVSMGCGGKMKGK